MKQKKCFLIIAIVCLAVVTIGAFSKNVYASSKKVYASPKKVTRMKLDGIFRYNADNSEKYNTYLAALFMSKLQQTQLACALEDPARHQKKFFQDIKKGLWKIDYDVSQVSVSGNKAKVSVRINYFKLQKIVKNGQKKFLKEMKKDASLSREKMADKLYESIAYQFQKGPSDNSKIKLNIYLRKKNNEWKLNKQFENKIVSAILQ